ncbi:unnamed protein product [Lampetra fluviatilis]
MAEAYTSCGHLPIPLLPLRGTKVTRRLTRPRASGPVELARLPNVARHLPNRDLVERRHGAADGHRGGEDATETTP